MLILLGQEVTYSPKPDGLVLLIAKTPADIERLLVIRTRFSDQPLFPEHERHVAKLSGLAKLVANRARDLQCLRVVTNVAS